MGIVHNNNVMATTTGTVGEVYFRMVRGKQIVSKLPGPGRKFSPRQLEWQKRFGEYAKKTKELLKDPEVKEQFQARIDNQKFTAHMVAQSDMMTAPKVEKIDASKYRGKPGDQIVMDTIDDVTIAKIVVTVIAESGALIESSEAARHAIFPDKWLYNAAVPNPDFKGSMIRVAVFDFYGKRTFVDLAVV